MGCDHRPLLTFDSWCLLGIRAQWAQSTALVALSVIAKTVGSLFAPRYATFMPGLKALIATAPTSEAGKELRGRAMECFALIAEAVGAEVCHADADALLASLLAEQQRGALPPTDAQTPYVLRTCSRIAGVLGDAFSKYLPVVLPPLLESAQKKVEMSMRQADGDPNGDDDDYDSMNVSRVTVAVRGVGNLQIKYVSCRSS